MLAVLTVVALLQGAVAQPSPADAVDSLVTAEMRRQHIPGVVVAILRDGRAPQFRSFGHADLEHGLPVTEHTVFKIGSVSKQFIAAASVFLARRGRLDLDGPASHYLDGAPPTWRGITVRHLLTHTAGFPREVPGWNSWTAYSPDSTARMLASIEPSAAPGHTHAYSNAGYFALAEIIRQVTGVIWSDFIRDSLLTPAGMRSIYPADYRLVIPNRAEGYNWSGDRWENDGLVVTVRPSGGLEASAADLARWITLLRTDSLLGPGSFGAMATPTALTSGELAPYGLGLEVTQFRDRLLIGHGGDLLGFSAMVARYPSDSITIIVLLNSSSANAGRLAADIAALLLPQASVRAWSPIRDPNPTLTNQLRQGLVNVGNNVPFGAIALEAIDAALRALPTANRTALLERMRGIDGFLLLRTESVVHAPVIRLGSQVTRIRYYRLTRGSEAYQYAFYFSADDRLVTLELLTR